MTAQTTYLCDSCGRSKAEHIGPLDLGDGPRMIDLCLKCVDKIGLAALVDLATEYGVEVGMVPVTPAARGASRNAAVACPACGVELSSRSYAIAHLQKAHGMSAVEASRGVPPNGPSKTCPHCGMLLSAIGYNSHIKFNHAEAVA